MRAYSDNGRPYFHNIRTGESRWTRPEPEPEPEPVSPRRQVQLQQQQQQQQQHQTSTTTTTTTTGASSGRSRTTVNGTSHAPTTRRSTPETKSTSTNTRTKSTATDPKFALYSQLLTSLCWYRGSIGNGVTTGDSASAGWFYLDKFDTERGPFPPHKMRAWYKQGHFNRNDLVRYGFRSTGAQQTKQFLRECHFLPIRYYFPKGKVEAFPEVERDGLVDAVQGLRTRLLQSLATDQQ